MSETKQKPIFGMNPMKVLFAMEYVLQGLANPFQGITYQPFFRHFRFHYGMTAADTQTSFSKSYLAWSFKPLIGFLMDAIGKTKLVMIFLLLSGAAMYLLTPFFDVSAIVFYWMMFALAILFACTDVAVDRATVLTGDEESKASGRSKAATVGLNQSICCAAIYGTSIVAAAWGGWIADNLAIEYLLFGLAAVPLIVFWVVLQLPRDTARSIPLKDSIATALYRGLGMGGLFIVVGMLSIAAIWLVAAAVPDAPPLPRAKPGMAGLAEALAPELLRLNVGIFVLHMVQMALFLVLPPLLVGAGLALADHWMLYLPVVLASFAMMVPPILLADRRNRPRPVLIARSACWSRCSRRSPFPAWGSRPWGCCCSPSSSPSTCWRRSCPRWCRGSPRPGRAARRSGCITLPRRWGCSSVISGKICLENRSFGCPETIPSQSGAK